MTEKPQTYTSEGLAIFGWALMIAAACFIVAGWVLGQSPLDPWGVFYLLVGGTLVVAHKVRSTPRRSVNPSPGHPES
ncbi:MAG: hypothetical protein ACTHON_00320 [Humibacter sp.]